MAALWASQHATPGGAPAGLCVATRKAPAVTPAGVLDFHAHGAFATPLDAESDDTPRSADAGVGWASGSGGSPERAEMGEDDEFDLEPGELAFQFGAAEHYSAASGLRAALAAGTPAPGGGTFSPPPPPAPRKGPTSFPSRVQGGSASASRCRERLACAARPPRARTWPRRTSFGIARLPDADSAAGSARPGTPPPPEEQQQQQPPALWDTVAPQQRAAPGSPSFLERAQGITGTRKRLDDALDDAVPCATTPKRLRGAEDMFAAMRLDT